MKLIEKINKIKQPVKKAMEQSYRTRKQFLRDSKDSETGLLTRHASTGYGEGRKSIQGLTFGPTEKIKYMQRRNNTAVALDISKEYKKVDNEMLLLKVTTTIYRLDPNINSSARYSYRNDEDTVNTAMKDEASEIVTNCYAIKVPKSTAIKVDRENSQLLIGPNGVCTKKSASDGMTKYILNDKKEILCVELTGINATLFDEINEEKLNHILNPSNVKYTSPKMKRQEMKLCDTLDTKGIEVGDHLMLHKISNENKLNLHAGKLNSVFEGNSIEIIASISDGTILTFNKDKKTVSQNIEAGMYSVRLQTPKSPEEGLGRVLPYDYRISVYNAAQSINIDFEVSRMDFLSDTELCLDDVTMIETDWSNRLDSEPMVITDDENNISDDYSNRY